MSAGVFAAGKPGAAVDAWDSGIQLFDSVQLCRFSGMPVDVTGAFGGWHDRNLSDFCGKLCIDHCIFGVGLSKEADPFWHFLGWASRCGTR